MNTDSANSNGTSQSDTVTSAQPSNRDGYLALKLGLVASVLLWLSFPPIGLWWLAWLAAIPLIWLVHIAPDSWRLPAVEQQDRSGKLKHRYFRQLYFVGLAYWLTTFYFIPIPHPALWLGWIVVSAYMACYTPLFVGVTRTMVHRFNIPVVVAAPVVWTGIEWFRSHFATGMALVCLSHTQYKQPILIQVADLSGGYTLTFAIMVFASGMAMVVWPLASKFMSNETLPTGSSSYLSATVGISSLIAVLAYGNHRINQEYYLATQNVLKVALIQSAHDVIFGPVADEVYKAQMQDKYQLTHQARLEHPDLHLIVWPESAFTPYADLISNVDEQVTVEAVANLRTQIWSNATGFPDRFPNPVPLLTGGGTSDPDNEAYYASAFLIANNGQVKKRYFKNHRVMFGEYVPFLDWFPALKPFSPITNITPGTEFETIEIEGFKLAPNICFESTVPHFIRRQVNTLSEQGNEPDILINMTNDGWFYGTSCLDLHLACNVFRAVEIRKPHLVCANTGFSAEIDDAGRLLQVGPRRQPGIIVSTQTALSRGSLYRTIGDVIPMLFGLITILVAIFGCWNLRKCD